MRTTQGQRAHFVRDSLYGRCKAGIFCHCLVHTKHSETDVSYLQRYPDRSSNAISNLKTDFPPQIPPKINRTNLKPENRRYSVFEDRKTKTATNSNRSSGSSSRSLGRSVRRNYETSLLCVVCARRRQRRHPLPTPPRGTSRFRSSFPNKRTN